MMANSPVGIIKTTPQSVLADYESLLISCGFDRFVDSDCDFLLAVDLGWDRFFPGASAPPWQIEGVARTISKRMKRGRHMEAFFFSPRPFRSSLKQFPKVYRDVLARYGIDEISEGSHRNIYEHKNVVFLSSLRTHLFHNIYGSMMSNAVFLNGGTSNSTLFLSAEEVCMSHNRIKHAASKIFAVLDGAFAGDGDGPNCIRVFTKDVILAGEDLVSLDAVAAQLMGFDPSSVPYLREAGKRSLGSISLDRVTKVGLDVTNMNFRFHNMESEFFKKFYHLAKKCFDFDHPSTAKLRFLPGILTWCAYMFAKFFWFKKLGKERLAKCMETKWGTLLSSYK